jgi:hypothetical protein
VKIPQQIFCEKLTHQNFCGNLPLHNFCGKIAASNIPRTLLQIFNREECNENNHGELKKS